MSELEKIKQRIASLAARIVTLRKELELLQTTDTGVTDHGALTGLTDDDHTHYYNKARGDAYFATSKHESDHAPGSAVADLDHYYATTKHASGHDIGGTDELRAYYAETPILAAHIPAHASTHDIAGSDELRAYFAETPILTAHLPTTLPSGAVASDHGTAGTDQLANISYGTTTPEAAATTTIGSLFFKYTA